VSAPVDIAIVDSGGANLASVKFAIERLGSSFVFTGDPDVIARASHVILPGVGAAANAMKILRERGLVECLRGLTQPVIGICLGMQLLFDWSAEGDTDLLGMLQGRVDKFETALPVPHMGWNTAMIGRDCPLLKNLPARPYFYFVHSYRVPVGDYTVAQTEYDEPFSSIVQQDNIFGCQFHPERSGRDGANLLKNFVEL
jgi:glutamine amidotransferase